MYFIEILTPTRFCLVIDISTILKIYISQFALNESHVIYSTNNYKQLELITLQTAQPNSIIFYLCDLKVLSKYLFLHKNLEIRLSYNVLFPDPLRVK